MNANCASEDWGRKVHRLAEDLADGESPSRDELELADLMLDVLAELTRAGEPDRRP